MLMCLKCPSNMLICCLICCSSYAIKFSNHATLRNKSKFCYQFARILCLGEAAHAVFLLFASSTCVSEAMHTEYWGEVFQEWSQKSSTPIQNILYLMTPSKIIFQVQRDKIRGNSFVSQLRDFFLFFLILLLFFKNHPSAAFQCFSLRKFSFIFSKRKFSFNKSILDVAQQYRRVREK